MKSAASTVRVAAIAGALGATTALAQSFDSIQRFDLDYINTMVNSEGPHNAPAGLDPTEGVEGPPFTISLSGATLMRTYTTSAGSTHDAGLDLNDDGVIDPEPTTSCQMNCDGDLDQDTFFGFNPLTNPPLDQLAPQVNGAAGHFWTIYYREDGSVGGIEDCVDSQIGNPPGNIVPPEGPTAANPIWVNRNRFNVPGGGTINGFTLDANNPQPLVQMGISDVKVIQAFAVDGTPAWDRRPDEPGYGLNPADAPPPVSGGGIQEDEQQLRLDTSLGAAGTAALSDLTVGIGSVSVVANPGVGLTQVTDRALQWLVVHGRWPNGTDINVVTRDTDSGTRNCINNNLRVDTSFGMGENDGGGPGPYPDTNNLGTQIRFGDKRSNSHMDPTVRTARYAIGYTTTSTAPTGTVGNVLDLLRVDFTSATGEDPDVAQGFLPTIAEITTGEYRCWCQQQYVRAVNPAFDPEQETSCPDNWPFLGDPDCQVKAYVDNLVNSVAQFPAVANAFTPADALLANNFILTDAMQVTHPFDGEPYSENSDYDSVLRDLLIQFYQFNFVAPEMVTGNYLVDPDGNGPLVATNGIDTFNEVSGDFNNDDQRTLADVAEFKRALTEYAAQFGACADCVYQPGPPIVLCNPAPFVFTSNLPGSPLMYPAYTSDFNSDACFDEEDAEFFCNTVVNAQGNPAHNQCLDMFRAAANAVAVRANADVNADGSVTCEDADVVTDLLALAGPDETLYLNEALSADAFDDAFIIGQVVGDSHHDNINADQNDDGRIDCADFAIVNAAAGGGCDEGVCGAAVEVSLAASNPADGHIDTLDTGAGNTLTAGIGGAGTADQGGTQYATIAVTFSGTPSPALTAGDVTVSCTGGTCPTVSGVTGSGAGPYQISLSGVIPPLHCTTLTFTGSAFVVGTTVQYQSSPGNVDQSLAANTQDLLNLIQALNNGAAAADPARYNVNRTGAANTQDLLRIIQLLNGVLTTQAFNQAPLTACP